MAVSCGRFRSFGRLFFFFFAQRQHITVSTFIFRIPDFLVQLQNNIGSGKTMCEIVGHRITEDSFDDEYVIFS